MNSKMTRRSALKTAALATTALIAAPYVRGAHAAGKLAIGFWDHWVPGANKTSEAIVKEWAEKEKVEVTIDYIPSQGNKNLLTIAAEAQARSGHDIMAMPTWRPPTMRKSLEPVDDVMKPLIKQNGAVNKTVEYLGALGRQVDRGAGDDRQPDQGPVLAHRPDEAACRHRRAGALSGRLAAEGGWLDHRCVSQGGRSLPEGRPRVRCRPRHDV